MKKNTRIFFKTLVISMCCIVLFVGVGYFYLSKKLVPTDIVPQEKVPYYTEIPENKGILFDVLGDKTYIYLDFEDNRIYSFLFFGEENISNNRLYGYPIDYTVESNIEFISDFVDYLDGIELTIEDGTLRYTGVQVEDIILADKNKDYKMQIFKAIIGQISEKGIDNNILLKMVETCKTNLTVPDFYYWPQYIKDMSTNLAVIDGL